MKIIAQLKDGARIQHVGDLTIGHVGAEVQIEIQDGSLIIDGNVGKGSTIALKISPELKMNMLSGNADKQIAEFDPGVETSLVESQDVAKPTFKIKIAGGIADHVTIQSEALIEANDIGKECSIRCEQGGVVANRIGKKTTIFAQREIKVTEIADGCSLVSKQSGVEATNIGNKVTVTAIGSLQAKNIGDLCKVNSLAGAVTAENVGVDTLINAAEVVSLQNIGDYSTITSKDANITAQKLENHIVINAANQIKLISMGSGCNVSSKRREIFVDRYIGANNTLDAEGSIIIRGDVGANSSITSHSEKIIVSGTTGHDVLLHAVESIRMKNVGDNAIICSEMSNVATGDVGVYVRITASEDIDIRGTCPDPSTLELKTTFGRVLRPTRPISNNVLPVAIVNASTAPSAQLASQSGLFAHKISFKPKGIIIPQAFRDPQTDEVMEDPVVLTLNGQSYERDEITSWLKINRRSPNGDHKMKHGQKIDEVLIPNRNLAEEIALFRQDHPELFDAQGFAL